MKSFSFPRRNVDVEHGCDSSSAFRHSSENHGSCASQPSLQIMEREEETEEEERRRPRRRKKRNAAWYHAGVSCVTLLVSIIVLITHFLQKTFEGPFLEVISDHAQERILKLLLDSGDGGLADGEGEKSAGEFNATTQALSSSPAPLVPNVSSPIRGLLVRLAPPQ